MLTGVMAIRDSSSRDVLVYTQSHTPARKVTASTRNKVRIVALARTKPCLLLAETIGHSMNSNRERQVTLLQLEESSVQ